MMLEFLRAREPHRRRQLAAVGLCVAACAGYDEPETLGPYDVPPGQQAGAGNGGASAGAGAPATSAGSQSPPTAGSPSGGTAGAAPGGGAGGTGTPEPGGSGGTAGAGGAPNGCLECPALAAALAHRYDFEGSGTAVMDRAGTAHGSIVGGAMLSAVAGKGVVVLDGGTAGSYVNLPNGLASALTSATFEAWLSWDGGAAWQRVFDFGDSTSATPEDNPATGNSYLFITAATDTASGGLMRAAYSVAGGAASAETRVDSAGALPSGGLVQVALVVDAAAGAMRLYQDGEKAGEQTLAGSLSAINDVNVWLGRSQYDTDPELSATFHDFRVYDAALTDAQIALSFASGPDPAFLAE